MSADLGSLRAAFSGRLLTTPEEMAPFLVDWRKSWRGAALAVAQPDTTEDVAAVVRWCAAEGAPVVPQGGNTGLSGGATPDPSGRSIVLSLARLDKVRTVDAANNTMVVEAGCILKRVQEAAAGAGRFFPLSLGSEGSCTIGGNLATNAGGTAVLRYGNARELCLGLEVVTAAGEVWDGLKGLRKDNTGYDLRDLFIGSEGTLGIITAAALKLFPKPKEKATALVGLPNAASALELFRLTEERAHGSLTAFEFMSRLAVELVVRHIPNTRLPIERPAPWYVLIELSSAEAEGQVGGVLERMLTEAADKDIIGDGVLAGSLAQTQSLWRLREMASEAQKFEGGSIKHDISVPIALIPDFLSRAALVVEAVCPGARPAWPPPGGACLR
jgi:FAD/FMN-containing dehydrogenase